MTEEQRIEASKVHPDFSWVLAFIHHLNECRPTIYHEPMNAERAERLAAAVVQGNYEAAYLMGGYIFIRMVQQEFEELERYEACAEIQQAMTSLFEVFHPIQEHVRAMHYGTPLD